MSKATIGYDSLPTIAGNGETQAAFGGNRTPFPHTSQPKEGTRTGFGQS